MSKISFFLVPIFFVFLTSFSVIINASTLIIVLSEEKISFFNEVLRHTIIGVELFPESFFKMQLGYSFRRSEELRILDQRNFSGISFGFGMKFNKLRFNYCHSRYSSASNVNFLGIQLDLD